MSDAKLFHEIVGVIPDGTALEGSGAAVRGDTPFIAFGLWLQGPDERVRKPMFIGYIPGGKVVSVLASALRVQLTTEMKKALAEVVMTT